MVKLQIINLTEDMPKNRVSDTFSHVTLNTINGVLDFCCGPQTRNAAPTNYNFIQNVVLIEPRLGTMIQASSRLLASMHVHQTQCRFLNRSRPGSWTPESNFSEAGDEIGN